VNQIVEAKNTTLPSYAKIKRFALLPEDFTVENGALTPTLKVKRRTVTDRYRDVIDALYR
jgi:long-chain acyl-CoA synthetase